MEHHMFIVKQGDMYFGPYMRNEVDYHAARLPQPREILPLWLSEASAGEEDAALHVRVLRDDDYQQTLDRTVVDTLGGFAWLSQTCWLAARDRRVLSRTEIATLWKTNNEMRCAVESLMHYAELAIKGPSPDALAALRKALWRNRESDDFDPHDSERSR